MILNLTQHKATPEQLDQGVVELGEDDKRRLVALLTFEEMPSKEEISRAAESIVELALAKAVQAAMIGGAPYLMAPLERALERQDIAPVYAYSKRVSEEKEVDGKVTKINVFKHIGFVFVDVVK